MFHPLHLLLYRVFPLDVAFNLELIATYEAACAGMFLWLARAGLDRRAALFGAMLLACSGFYLWHYQHVNVVSGLAHVPWLLLATDVLFETLPVVLVTTLVVLASRRFRGAMLALVVITAADIGWWGYQEVFRRPPRSIHALLDGIDAPGGAVARRVDLCAERRVRGESPHPRRIPAGIRLRGASACDTLPLLQQHLTSTVGRTVGSTRRAGRYRTPLPSIVRDCSRRSM